MNKNDHFLRFFLQQQNEHRIAAFVTFLNKNISDPNLPLALLAQRMIDYYSDEKNSDGRESWSKMVGLVNKKTLEKLLPQAPLDDDELISLFTKTKKDEPKTKPKPNPKLKPQQSKQLQTSSPIIPSYSVQSDLSSISTVVSDVRTTSEEHESSTDSDCDEETLLQTASVSLEQQNLDLEKQLKELEKTLKAKNKKLKFAQKDAAQAIRQVIKNLSKKIQDLKEEIDKNTAAIAKLNLKLTLEKEAKQILTELSVDCPNIKTLLKDSPISPQTIGVSGSRIYSRVIKSTQLETKFKDKKDKQDWDLYCLVGDQKFNIGLLDNEGSARDFCAIYLKDFDVKTVNISRGNSVSFKLEYKSTKAEFDLNIYPASKAKEMHQWQYSYDRILLNITEEEPQFAINNNGLVEDQHLDFDQFVDKLSRDSEFDIWKTNEQAKKFLPRILKGSGTIEMPYQSWEKIIPKLKEEFLEITKRISQKTTIQGISNPEQKFAAIKHQFFDDYKIDLTDKKDKKILDIYGWFEECKTAILQTPARSRVVPSSSPDPRFKSTLTHPISQLSSPQ